MAAECVLWHLQAVHCKTSLSWEAHLWECSEQKLARQRGRRGQMAYRDACTQCALDSGPPRNTSSNDGSPEKQAICSPVHEQTTSHSSIPARRAHVPMDPVLQAERLRAAQELEALRRAQEEELVFSQTGTVLLWFSLAINLALSGGVDRQDLSVFDHPAQRSRNWPPLAPKLPG